MDEGREGEAEKGRLVCGGKHEIRAVLGGTQQWDVCGLIIR